MQNDMWTGDTLVKCFLHRGLLNDWLGDHVVQDRIVFPGAGLIELSLAAYRRCHSASALTSQSEKRKYCLDGFVIHRPVIVRDVRRTPSEKCSVLMCVVGSDGSVRVYSDERDDQGDRLLHAEAMVSIDADVESAHVIDITDKPTCSRST